MKQTIENIQSGKESMVKVLLRYCLPCIIGLILTSSMIVVDGIFIGLNIGENGLAALSLTLPLMYVLCAVTTTLGVGGITLGARSLGAGDHRRANFYFSLSISAILIITGLMIGIVMIFFDETIVLLGANSVTDPYIRDFLGTIQYFYLFFMLNIAFSMFIRAEGKPGLSLAFSLAGNIINLLLDYLLIVRFDLGMTGAALASGIAVLLPFLFGLGYFVSNKSVYHFCRFIPQRGDLTAIAINGLPEFISQIALAVTTFAFNIVLLDTLGVIGVAAFTIIGYVSFIYTMIMTGIGIGVHPLWSYSFGAQNTRFIIDSLRVTAAATFFLGLLLCVITITAAENMIALFAAGNLALLKEGTLGLQCFSAAFILSGYNFIATIFFTAVGKAAVGALISFLRSLALVLCTLIILPSMMGSVGIWLAVPLAELISFIGIYCARKHYRLIMSQH